MRTIEELVATQNPKGIQYNDITKTFRLYCGESLYAFAVGPELCLEHLYWGPALNPNFDLRYFSAGKN